MENTLGEIIRKVREQASLNQTQFGIDIGVVANTVSAYERGDRIPEIDTLIIISIKFNADLTELIKLRVLESQSFELENESILTFFNKINAYELVPKLPNQLAKQQMSYLKNVSSLPDSGLSTLSMTTGLEVNKNYFLNCCHAYFHFYNQQPVESFFKIMPEIIDVHNYINKLSPILGVDVRDITSLEPLDIEKLMDALSVLNRIPKQN
jgi:transcriptional regulator with XRE-family HTH domain